MLAVNVTFYVTLRRFSTLYSQIADLNTSRSFPWKFTETSDQYSLFSWQFDEYRYSSWILARLVHSIGLQVIFFCVIISVYTLCFFMYS